MSLPLSKMTSQERLLAALSGREVDHVPFSPFLAYVWDTFPNHIRDKGQTEFYRMIGADPLHRGAPCPVTASGSDKIEMVYHELPDELHTEIVTPVGTLTKRARKSSEGNTWFLVEHVLKKEEDYNIYMWIIEHTGLEFTPQKADEFLRNEAYDGVALGMLVPFGKSAYQRLVEDLVGTEELVYALMDYPEKVEALWRKMVEKDLEAVRMAAQSDYEYFISFEDSSTQNYSPSQYEQYISSEIRQWCAILAEHGKKYVQHACGHVKALVKPMLEDGVCAVESISPPPTGNISIAEVRGIVGDRMGIIGGIEPTELLNLDIDALSSYVEKVIAEGRGGPFVLANSDSCPPGVTIEKFQRIVEVAKTCRG